MEMTIKSVKLNKTLTFWKQDGADRYVYLVSDERPGTTGQQICRGGHFSGATLSCSDDNFERICRNWYRNYVHQQDLFG